MASMRDLYRLIPMEVRKAGRKKTRKAIRRGARDWAAEHVVTEVPSDSGAEFIDSDDESIDSGLYSDIDVGEHR